MSRQWIVVYEAPADFAVATELADRVLVEAIEWLDESMLDHQREWVGSIGNRFTRWTTVAQLAREQGIRVHGHFDGSSSFPDAKAARRAITLIKRECGDAGAIILVRDADKEGERREGLEQARARFESDPIVIALANPEREAWVICGFEPDDTNDQARLEAERRELGFDPRLQSQELTATSDDQAKKSPKRVLRALTNDSREREQRCWSRTSLDTLKSRGKGNGLCEYLGEVEKTLAPLIGGNQGGGT